MKELVFCMFAAYLFIPVTTASAAVLNNQEQSNLISAIDDYRFSDYNLAIEKLEILHQKSPNNPEVLQYLALSYDETDKPKKAMAYFQAWLKANNNNTSENARFAWLGLANAQAKTGNNNQAIQTLNTWLKANPDDTQTQITLGDMLIRQNKYNASKPVWESILASNSANSSDKAAAWYYKSWLSYLEGNPETTKQFAQESLSADNEGAYASAAKNLETNPSQKRLGFNGFASLETFYNSNVMFAPENSSTYSRDLGVQTNVSLGWNLPKINLNYTFSSTNHQDYKAYDLLIHVLSASWRKDNQWRFKPSYEYVALDTSNLYQSFGLGIFYNQNSWTYQYTVKFKTFNNAYGSSKVDLERLGGSSHYLGARKSFKTNGFNVSLSPHLIAELTKGDASHAKSDSYYQLGASASAAIPFAKKWNETIKLDLYSRLYAEADTNILLNATDTTKRKDNYFRLSSATSWKPWDAYHVSIVFNASYLKNASNYDDTLVTPTASKSYSAWRVGSMIMGQW